MYFNREGVTKNFHTAIEWFTNAANQGNVHAQFYLGYIYQYKDELKDLQKAVNWYQKAVDNNDGRAKRWVKILEKQGYYAKEQ
jgi:TPR repeat protein